MFFKIEENYSTKELHITNSKQKLSPDKKNIQLRNEPFQVAPKKTSPFTRAFPLKSMKVHRDDHQSTNQTYSSSILFEGDYKHILTSMFEKNVNQYIPLNHNYRNSPKLKLYIYMINMINHLVTINIHCHYVVGSSNWL